MGGIPYAGQPFQVGGDNITRLLMEQGRLQGDAAANQGAIWGNAVAGLGQQVGGALQQHQAEKEKRREQEEYTVQDQAFIKRISDTTQPPITALDAVKIYGMQRGPAIYKAWESLQSDKPDLPTVLAGFDASRPEMRALGWPQARAHLLRGGAPAEFVPEQYDDEWYQRFSARVRGDKPAGLHNVPAGTTAIDEATREPVFTAPATPPKPPAPPAAGSFEDYMTTTPERQAQIRDARKGYQQADDRPRISVTLPGGVLSPNQEAQLTTKLSTEYARTAKPAVELRRQLSLMESGLEAAKKGDMNAGQQAVLVTFQKILDPISVVREAEYFRTAAGQSVLDRMEGAYTKLLKGGAGFTAANLEEFARLARQAVSGYNDSLKATRERIERQADRYKIPHELVITDYDFGSATGEPVAGATPAAAGPRQIKNDAEYDALPAGAEYIDPTGKRRRKK